MLVLILVCSVVFGKDSHQIRFDGKVLVIDDRRGRKEQKHTKTSKNDRKQTQGEEGAATIQQNSATATLLSHRIITLDDIQVGVEWRGILNS